MDQFPQSACVAAVSRSTGKWRLQATAQAAARFALSGDYMGAYQALAADEAAASANGPYGGKALGTNRKARNIYKGGTAKTAIGRK